MKKNYIFTLLSMLIMFTESRNDLKRDNDICNSIIQNDGWKDLNDVNSIVYRLKTYSLKNHRKDIVALDCNKRVRVLTITLACSYLIDLKILFFIFAKFGKHCKSLISNSDTTKTGYSCAMKLLNILKKIPSLATLMKETLYVLDYLHTYSWTKNFIFKNVFINLAQFNKISKDYIPMENDSTTTEKFIELIQNFFYYKNIDTMYKSYIHCNFEPFNTESFGKTLNEEYQEKTLQYFDYLSEKVNLKINSIIINKFHRLGFRHDRKTQQIGIPLPSKYKTDDIEFFTRPKKPFDTYQTELQNEDVENHWILEVIDSFENELVKESSNNEEEQLIDFHRQELVNESNTNEEVQLIDFHGQELVNESNSNEEVQLIDFLGQGLKPNDSYEVNLDPMEIDENRENFIKFL